MMLHDVRKNKKVFADAIGSVKNSDRVRRIVRYGGRMRRLYAKTNARPTSRIARFEIADIVLDNCYKTLDTTKSVLKTSDV